MLFFTSHFYALGRQYGIEQAMRRIAIQIESPDRESMPAVRTIARLRQLDEVHVRNDCGATSIGRARSRAFHDALQSEAEVWVTCDDDVEATSVTLRWMLQAVRESNGVCLVPYILRTSDQQQAMTSVQLEPWDESKVHELVNGGKAVPVFHGGFGLVAIARYAMQQIAEANQDLDWLDDDGVRRLAMFYEQMVDGRWFGEDLSFFLRIPQHIAVEALVTGDSVHAGQVLKLESVLEAHITQAGGLQP